MQTSELSSQLINFILALQEAVTAEQNKKAAQVDTHSRVTFEVEVLHFQAYLQAEMAPGAFLLAAQKGRVEGRNLPHLLQNLITLTLDQVQLVCLTINAAFRLVKLQLSGICTDNAYITAMMCPQDLLAGS